MDGTKQFILISTVSFKLLNDLSKALRDNYEIIKAIDGAQTIRALSDKNVNFACAIIDINQPNLDIFQILGFMQKSPTMKYIPVIVVGDKIEEDEIKKCSDAGVADLIIMPANPYKLCFAVERTINNNLRIKELELKLLNEQKENDMEKIESDEDIKKENVDLKAVKNEVLSDIESKLAIMLGTIVEFRGFSQNHITRVREITRIICDTLITYFPESNLSTEDAKVITDASCYHDIGKLLVFDKIMTKPSKLTDEEFDIVKSHTTKGCEILDSIKEYQTEKMYHYCYEICRYHHERYDGKGYPEGLKGENIPLAAQIVSIVDAFDALMTNTSYRKAIDFEKAYSMVIEGECGMFSPRISQCFKMNKEKIAEVARKYADPYA